MLMILIDKHIINLNEISAIVDITYESEKRCVLILKSGKEVDFPKFTAQEWMEQAMKGLSAAQREFWQKSTGRNN